MIYLHLDASNVTNRSDLHDLFAQTLSLPEWYGRNLDALHDCLTAQSEDVCIAAAEDELIGTLGERYVGQLLRLLRDSAEENPHITLK
ncbi:MAG: ribonuclease barnase inhibitor barstar [Clostridiales bacterium]|nr:ribonuclease barnase inhibitor barstar [Clostridiales bacterium]